MEEDEEEEQQQQQQHQHHQHPHPHSAQHQHPHAHEVEVSSSNPVVVSTPNPNIINNSNNNNNNGTSTATDVVLHSHHRHLTQHPHSHSHPTVVVSSDPHDDEQQQQHHLHQQQQHHHHQFAHHHEIAGGEHHHEIGDHSPDTQQQLHTFQPVVLGGSHGGEIDASLKATGREPATEWSETATGVLINAFREKFHALDRNNFRSKDWAEVAKRVNALTVGEKTPKSQEQCRMKVDSLKKRYRQEKDKLPGNGPCKWPWFELLDELIGGSPKQSRIGSARKQARFLCSPPQPRPAGGVPTPYFRALSPSLYLKKKVARVFDLQESLGQCLMAGSLEENIEALLQNFLEEETARNFSKKLASSKYTVATLLEMSERELDEIIAEEFPEAARGERRGFKAAIWSKKRKLAQDSGDELDLVNASGSMMETSDNFAKKEKKSGSFVQ